MGLTDECQRVWKRRPSPLPSGDAVEPDASFVSAARRSAMPDPEAGDDYQAAGASPPLTSLSFRVESLFPER